MVRANWGGDVDEFVREEKNNPNGLGNRDWFETDEESISHIPHADTRRDRKDGRRRAMPRRRADGVAQIPLTYSRNDGHRRPDAG